LLPVAGVRKVVQRLALQAYPNPRDRAGKTLTGEFTRRLIGDLNATGLVKPVSWADGRSGKAMTATSRAYMFYKQEKAGTPIDSLAIPRVAALVMPTVVRLSDTAEDNMMEALGRPAYDLEKAIALRRLVARTGFEVA